MWIYVDMLFEQYKYLLRFPFFYRSSFVNFISFVCSPSTHSIIWINSTIPSLLVPANNTKQNQNASSHLISSMWAQYEQISTMPFWEFIITNSDDDRSDERLGDGIMGWSDYEDQKISVWHSDRLSIAENNLQTIELELIKRLSIEFLSVYLYFISIHQQWRHLNILFTFTTYTYIWNRLWDY